MITGAIWEKVVFDQYLFHEAFFWEDVVSFGVIAVHTAYLWGLFAQGGIRAEPHHRAGAPTSSIP
jgi:3-vinyl bacteriochlorophyllide hydratase